LAAIAGGNHDRMSRIDVDPGQVRATGQAIAALLPTVTQVGWSARAVATAADEPPATSAALTFLSQAWTTGAGNLEDELRSLGDAAEGAAFLYTLTDEQAIPFSAP
jgi:hypothetical protein